MYALTCFFCLIICADFSLAPAAVRAEKTTAGDGIEAVPAGALPVTPAEPHVAILRLNTMILPGTEEYVHAAIDAAETDGARAIVLLLDTPGGVLTSTQEIVQQFFKSSVPVLVYVWPSGATATSAGVFITLAAHVAAMAPGTTVGAAHPVAGDGKDIDGDMRKKVENMTTALVRSIAEQRGRNVAWAEKSVRESISFTEREALQHGVVDLIATDVDELLRQAKGRQVKLGNEMKVLEDLSKLPRRFPQMSLRQRTVNFLANPSVAALLWLVATTGISIELYNPGAILPGVVGVIALVLALAVSQIIPVTQSGVLLLLIGALLIGAELIVPSGILGVGGIVAMAFGALYLIDVAEAPGLAVNRSVVLSAALIFGGFLLFIVSQAVRALRTKPVTGREGLIGQRAQAVKNFSGRGKVFVNGEVWDAELPRGLAEAGEFLEVSAVKDGLLLEVRKLQ